MYTRHVMQRHVPENYSFFAFPIFEIKMKHRFSVERGSKKLKLKLKNKLLPPCHQEKSP